MLATENVFGLVIPEKESIDIDTEFDFILAETLLLLREAEKNKKLSI